MSLYSTLTLTFLLVVPGMICAPQSLLFLCLASLRQGCPRSSHSNRPLLPYLRNRLLTNLILCIFRGMATANQRAVVATVNGSIPALHLTQPVWLWLVVVEVVCRCSFVVSGTGLGLSAAVRSSVASNSSFQGKTRYFVSCCYPLGRVEKFFLTVSDSLRRGWRDDQTDGPCLRLCVD